MIRGYAELLSSRDDERIRAEAPLLILQAAARLSPALDAVVAALSADSGNVALRRCEVELRPAIEEALETLALPDEVEVAMEDDLAVYADPDWLHRLLVCLVGSAAGAADLVLGCQATGRNVTLSLRRRTPMSFVSAYAVRRLCELHGGRFWITDAAGGGRVAYAVLPLARQEPEARLRSILVADDDETVRELLRMTLPAESYEILEATDGAEALEIHRSRDVDLVLLDWRMPERPGAEVLDELHRTSSHLPVVVLTAETEQAHRERAAELGAAAFLTKPFSPIELLGLVERLLPPAAA